MDKKPSSNQAHKLDTQGARQLVFILAVSFTLGFWALFSRIDHDQSAKAENNQAAGDAPPVQSENQLVLDLPPMPTLIPSFDPSMTSLAIPTVTFQNPIGLSQPSVPLTGKIFLGGSKPQSGAPAPAPITSTGSSK